MKQAKSLLDSLMAGLADLTEGQDANALVQKARRTWDCQSTLAKGAIGGGLMGVLLSGRARRLVGTGARIGGAALIGGLAYKAYTDWQMGKPADARHAPVALPGPDGLFAMDDDFAERLLQAMVAAAKADGHITPSERLTIDAQLVRLGLEPEAQALIAAELDSPMDVGRIAGLARNEAEAVEIYTASLLVVDEEGAAEKGYMAMLAARLGLEPDLVTHIHTRAAEVV